MWYEIVDEDGHNVLVNENSIIKINKFIDKNTIEERIEDRGEGQNIWYKEGFYRYNIYYTDGSIDKNTRIKNKPEDSDSFIERKKTVLTSKWVGDRTELSEL